MAPGDAPLADTKAAPVGLARNERRLSVAIVLGVLGQRRQGHLEAGIEDRRVQAIIAEFGDDGFGSLDPPQGFAGPRPRLCNALEGGTVVKAMRVEAAVEVFAVNLSIQPLADSRQRLWRSAGACRER